MESELLRINFYYASLLLFDQYCFFKGGLFKFLFLKVDYLTFYGYIFFEGGSPFYF